MAAIYYLILFVPAYLIRSFGTRFFSVNLSLRI